MLLCNRIPKEGLELVFNVFLLCYFVKLSRFAYKLHLERKFRIITINIEVVKFFYLLVDNKIL